MTPLPARQRATHIAALVALCTALAGCPRRPTDTAAAGPGRAVPESHLAAGQEAYLNHDYARAVETLGAYSEAHSHTARGQEARYWYAMSLLELGHARRARLLLLEVRNHPLAPRPLQALALRGTAQTYVAEGDYAAAETAFLRLRSLYPAASSEEETLGALIECASKANNRNGMDRYRRQLHQINPQSPYLAGVENGAPSAQGHPDYVIVQAGVFTSRVLARQLVTRLKHKGIDAIVVTRPEIGTGYAVQAGAFSTRAAAHKQADRLKRLGFDAILKP